MHQILTTPTPTPSPARMKLQALLSEIETQKEAIRAEDPDYLVAKAAKAQRIKQEVLRKERELENAKFQRRSKLTALSGESLDTEINLAIFSGVNYRMSSANWEEQLSHVRHLFVREPDFKGFVRIRNYTFPVIGFLGTLNGESISLDLFSLRKTKHGALSQIAYGLMMGKNNNYVKFHLAQSNTFITCELQTDHQQKDDEHMLVVGQELYSRMFGNLISLAENSEYDSAGVSDELMDEATEAALTSDAL